MENKMKLKKLIGKYFGMEINSSSIFGNRFIFFKLINIEDIEENECLVVDGFTLRHNNDVILFKKDRISIIDNLKEYEITKEKFDLNLKNELKKYDFLK